MEFKTVFDQDDLLKLAADQIFSSDEWSREYPSGYDNEGVFARFAPADVFWAHPDAPICQVVNSDELQDAFMKYLLNNCNITQVIFIKEACRVNNRTGRAGIAIYLQK